ncbi:DoxX family protein [Demequina lignilytica]|uniref:DoxX family protein n=1 Tax=Demequina lignilytica TaxID=3051663 RepID=A0AAW7M8P0_9MICO|nr:MULTISPECIES: DoxX family protein [unclassified Demequina]MDN4477383.1 DoxX family protein [Demequina sp. SYSU T00039-1]MDN4483126.1 DoxX family protein [Demequina sp. SYSU T0a273]MDN4487556.1 DoxX family protein [Demequina sp. SYSU T00039]
MDIVFLVARILVALIFLFSAFGHIAAANAMAQYAAYKGAPGGKAGVILSGVAMGIGGVMILLGVWGEIGALLIAATLIPITFFMHAYWKETDAQAKQTEQISFNKNLGLIGGALALFLLFASQGAAMGLTITEPLIALA